RVPRASRVGDGGAGDGSDALAAHSAESCRSRSRTRLVPVSFVAQMFPLSSCGGLMRYFLKGSVCAAYCLLLVSQALAQNPPSTKVEAPSLKVGDSWTYDRTDGWKNLKEYTSVVVVTTVTEGEVRTEAKRI